MPVSGVLVGPESWGPTRLHRRLSSLSGSLRASGLPGVDLQQARDRGDDHQPGRDGQVVGRQEVDGPHLGVVREERDWSYSSPVETVPAST